MTGNNYNLLAFLPALSELGSLPPLSVAEFLDAIKINQVVWKQFRIVLLSEDLRRRTEIIQGNEKADAGLYVLKRHELIKDDCIKPYFSEKVFNEAPNI